jgi:hypothetical protein
MSFFEPIASLPVFIFVALLKGAAGRGRCEGPPREE